MAQWQTADAKQRFIDLVEAANTDGPQVVLRHEEPVAIVLSPEDALALRVRQADTNFADLLGQSPFAPEDTQPVGIEPDQQRLKCRDILSTPTCCRTGATPRAIRNRRRMVPAIFPANSDQRRHRGRDASWIAAA